MIDWYVRNVAVLNDALEQLVGEGGGRGLLRRAVLALFNGTDNETCRFTSFQY